MRISDWSSDVCSSDLYILKNFVCTLQMAVSHHGPDEYEIRRFLDEPLHGFTTIAKADKLAFSTYDTETKRREMSTETAEVLGQLISKPSRPTHSSKRHVLELTLASGQNKR